MNGFGQTIKMRKRLSSYKSLTKLAINNIYHPKQRYWTDMRAKHGSDPGLVCVLEIDQELLDEDKKLLLFGFEIILKDLQFFFF